MKYFKPLFVLNTEFSILKKSNITKDLFKNMYKEVLAPWKGCLYTRSLLEPESFYFNKCTLLKSSHHHPNSHKAKFPEPPGGARVEGQAAYDGCRSALKTILPGADGPGFPTPGLGLDGLMSTNREGGTTQVTGLNSKGSFVLLADPPSDIILKFTDNTKVAGLLNGGAEAARRSRSSRRFPHDELQQHQRDGDGLQESQSRSTRVAHSARWPFDL